jgi:hypothetical protein
MERRIADGVDGIITNYPARLAEVLSRVESSDRQEPGARIQKSGDRKWVGGGI